MDEGYGLEVGTPRLYRVFEPLEGTKPDWQIIQEIATPEATRAAADQDRKATLEGGRNVYNAGRVAGAKRYIV
jgi:nucleoside-diphosphate-sugar epimerase